MNDINTLILHFDYLNVNNFKVNYGVNLDVFYKYHIIAGSYNMSQFQSDFYYGFLWGCKLLKLGLRQITVGCNKLLDPRESSGRFH